MLRRQCPHPYSADARTTRADFAAIHSDETGARATRTVAILFDTSAQHDQAVSSTDLTILFFAVRCAAIACAATNGETISIGNGDFLLADVVRVLIDTIAKNFNSVHTIRIIATPLLTHYEIHLTSELEWS